LVPYSYPPIIMLAHPQRRQHLPHTPSSLPSPPSSQQNFSFDQLSHQYSAHNLFDQKLLNDYLESQSQAFANPLIVDDDVSAQSNPFMTGLYDFSNPTIRIQQSTPTPQLPSGFSQSPMLSSSATAASHDLGNWSTFANNGQLDTQNLQTPAQSRVDRTHQRASSSSSIGSSGSHYQAVDPTIGYPAFSNQHLPTPTHTPTHDSFMNSNFNNYPSSAPGMDQTMSAHMSMKQALMDQHDDDVPGFAHSARHSVSSYGHDSPATPHTTHGDDFEDRFKVPPTDLRPATVPKFERNFGDLNVDTFYDNGAYAQQQSLPQGQAPQNASLLSPYRQNSNEIVQRTLQAAQVARAHSPSNSGSRGVSPFRHNSPFRQPSNFNSPRMRVGTAAQAREQKVEADAAYAMKRNVASSDEAQPKTISPKEALLDYREADDDSKVPLFPESGASEYEHQYNGGDQYRNATQSSFDTTSGQSYRRDSWATPQFSPNFTTTTTGPTPPSAAAFTFTPPSIQGNMHGLPYTGSHYRTAPSNMPTTSDQVPDFPAHLTSMESSASEAGPENASQSSDLLQKPASTTADSGTYSCTYHGCAQRFETPQKLQKHKREGHRNANVATIASPVASASAALTDRNSQAGPHKCERINPTTGKPCNTIFSRPYDLTRHEDTIHNARKQKVRCALCAEEKTFSRNDALTRHMRVVHPEIDFPGKFRKRGGNHE